MKTLIMLNGNKTKKRKEREKEEKKNTTRFSYLIWRGRLRWRRWRRRRRTSLCKPRLLVLELGPVVCLRCFVFLGTEVMGPGKGAMLEPLRQLDEGVQVAFCLQCDGAFLRAGGFDEGVG